MNTPDFEAAKQYALDRLENELSPLLVYHSLFHTRDDVLLATERLAAIEGVDGEALMLLRTAALYHDIGFLRQRINHEDAGVAIASEVLPRFGYTLAQIQAIGGMIMATKLPQTPHNLFEEILADADLDALGREDYWERSMALRAELAIFEAPVDDRTWLIGQVNFLEGHSYFTDAAHNLRDARKQQNIDMVKRWLSELDR